jgi:hypothetical protein
MAADGRYCRALFWVRTPWGLSPIVPLRGVVMLGALLGLLATIAALVDWQLHRHAEKGVLSSSEWERENRLIEAEIDRKIASNEGAPLFRSLGYEPPAPAPGRRRILVIGDSFIQGAGHTNINIIWWRQLAWELERRGYRDVDVVAAGLSGAGTQDQLSWLRNPAFMQAARPDLMVLGYVTNDPQMKDATGAGLVKYYVPPAAKPQQADVVLPMLRHQLGARAAAQPGIEGNDEVGYPYAQWELKILEGESFRRYRELLKELAAWIAQQRIPTLYVTTPNRPDEPYFEQRHAPVREAFKSAGIELNDLLPQLLKCCSGTSPPLGWGVNPANGHPGPQMTHFYAVQVADLLERRHRALLGARSEAARATALAINDWMPARVNPRRSGENEWTFAFPENEAKLLRMPVGIPHVALNFERPALLREVVLTGSGADRFRVWAMVLDQAGHERRDYVPMGEGAGPRLALAVPSELAQKRVTSLRIARHTDESDSHGNGSRHTHARQPGNEVRITILAGSVRP